MRRKNNYLVAVANNGKLRQRFTPGVPRTFDQDRRLSVTSYSFSLCSVSFARASITRWQ